MANDKGDENKEGNDGPDVISAGERIPHDSAMNWEFLSELSHSRLLEVARKAATERGIDESKITELEKYLKLLTAYGNLLEKAVFQGQKTDAEARDELNRTPMIPELKELLVELGLVEQVLKGDWEVSRISEIWKSAGIVSYRKMENLHEEFLRHYYGDEVIDREIKSGKPLVHLEIGCGSGIILEGAFGNKNWRRIGYADKILYSLKDQLKSLIKPEHEENEALVNFVGLVATLASRAIFYLKNSDIDLNPQMKTLLKMSENPNIIIYVLKDLKHYFPILSEMKELVVDEEFLTEAVKDIDSDCQKLIQDYSNDPESFLAKYFIDDIFREPESSGIVEAEILEEIGKLEKEIEEDQSLQIGTEDRDSIMSAKKLKIHDLRNQLADSKRGAINFASRLAIYPRKIVLGQFKDFGSIFPNEQFIDMATGFRSLSHDSAEGYGEFLNEVATRLKPGGFIEDDGVRESYTREFRVKTLIDLQKTLGPDYKISLLVEENGKEPLTSFIEKAININGERHFFSDYAKDRLFTGGNKKLVAPEEFDILFPILSIKDEIVRRVRDLFEEATDGDRKKAVMYFRGIRSNIDDWLEENEMPKWRLGGNDPGIMIPSGGLSDEEYEMIIDKIKDIPIIQERLIRARHGEPPMRFEHVIGPFKEDESKITRASELPKANSIPTLKSIEGRALCKRFRRNLQEITRLTKKPPLNLVEFPGCFTNDAMKELLAEFLGDRENITEFLKVHTVDLSRSEKKYPETKEGEMWVIGGSRDSVLEGRGKRFSSWVKKILDRIKNGEAVSCFGNGLGGQLIARGAGLYLVRRNGEFGVVPAVTSQSNLWHGNKEGEDVKEGQAIAIPVVRTAFVVATDEKLRDKNIEVLISGASGDFGPSSMANPDNKNPLMISVYGGKAIGSMGSIELRALSREQDAERLAAGQSNFEHYSELSINKGYMPTGNEFNENGARDSGAFMFLHLLNKQAEVLLENLKAKMAE